MKEQLIQDYFEGTLSSVDRSKFDELLEKDADFKRAFQFEVDVRQALINEKKLALKATFKDQEKQHIGTKKPVNNYLSFFVKYGIAAMLLILLSVVGYQQFDTSTSYDGLYADNFEPYRNIVAPITRTADTLTQVEIAFKNYELKKYEAAETQLIKLAQETDKASFYFYLGITQLELDKPQDAISNLDISSAMKGEFQEKSNWYLALAYLKNNQGEPAKELLTKIVLAQSYGHTKAAVILKEL